MFKRTFADVKEELRRVAGQTGTQATDARLQELVSLAQERLCTLGEWPYQYARVKLRQFGGVVSLPCEYEALVHTLIEGEPIEVQPTWFEFLEFGPGPQDRARWANLGLDLGESPVLRQPPRNGARLRVSSTSGDDVTGVVTVTGYDLNGVRRVETFALPQASTTTQWSKIVQVTKPITAGDVVLSYTDGWGTQSIAATYRARDVTPTFRQYRFTAIGDDETKTVQGIVRRRLYPVKHDSDELFITNLGALRLGVKAIALEDKGDIGGAASSFELAASILRNEATLYRASRNVAPVNVAKIQALSPRPDIF